MCDVGNCKDAAYVLVRFKVGGAYSYCHFHGTKRDPRTGDYTAEARFGRFDRSARRWVTAVASEQTVTRSKRRK